MQLACNTGTTLSRHLVSSSTIWSYLAWNKNNLVNSTETIISICEIICLGLSPNLSSCQVQRPYIISTTHCLNQTQIFAQIRIVIYKQPKTLGNHTARHSLSHALILLNIHISGVESKTSIWQRRQKQQFIQTVFFPLHSTHQNAIIIGLFAVKISHHTRLTVCECVSPVHHVYRFVARKPTFDWGWVLLA